MIITYTCRRIQNALEVTVVTDLSGTVYYHWWLDGAYKGVTAAPVKTFFTAVGVQSRVDVVDTTDADFDPTLEANQPTTPPASRVVEWLRSIDADGVDHYLVEEQADSGAWTEIATVFPRGEWSFRVATARLDDLTDYAWRVTAYDLAGNASTPATIAAEQIVRLPDAPQWTATFAPLTRKVTVAEVP